MDFFYTKLRAKQGAKALSAMPLTAVFAAASAYVGYGVMSLAAPQLALAVFAAVVLAKPAQAISGGLIGGFVGMIEGACKSLSDLRIIRMKSQP